MPILRAEPAPFLRDLGQGAALLPLGLVAGAAVLAGRPAAAARRLGARVGSPARMLLAAAATALLGLLALVPLGVEVLAVLRGLLYGLVDPGPYATSWGGPTRTGAWLAHAAVAVPLAAAGLVALRLLAGLHRRLVARLDGRPAPAWTVPATLLAVAAGSTLVLAWARQI